MLGTVPPLKAGRLVQVEKQVTVFANAHAHLAFVRPRCVSFYQIVLSVRLSLAARARCAMAGAWVGSCRHAHVLAHGRCTRLTIVSLRQPRPPPLRRAHRRAGGWLAGGQCGLSRVCVRHTPMTQSLHQGSGQSRRSIVPTRQRRGTRVMSRRSAEHVKSQTEASTTPYRGEEIR